MSRRLPTLSLQLLLWCWNSGLSMSYNVSHLIRSVCIVAVWRNNTNDLRTGFTNGQQIFAEQAKGADSLAGATYSAQTLPLRVRFHFTWRQRSISAVSITPSETLDVVDSLLALIKKIRRRSVMWRWINCVITSLLYTTLNIKLTITHCLLMSGL